MPLVVHLPDQKGTRHTTLQVIKTFTRLFVYFEFHNAHFDFAERTKRDCGTCGTNIIPYPLSTGPHCGDPSYELLCNTTNGQVYFVAPNNKTYRVTNIDRERRIFSIQIDDRQDCSNVKDVMEKFLQLNQSSVFFMNSSCTTMQRKSNDFEDTVFQEVEIQWKPASEPVCSSSIKCIDWPNSTCTETGHGEGMCLCNAPFHWDNVNLICRNSGKYIGLVTRERFDQCTH